MGSISKLIVGGFLFYFLQSILGEGDYFQFFIIMYAFGIICEEKEKGACHGKH